MASVAPLRFEDDAPPPSGVRRRVPLPGATAPRPAASDASDAQIVAEVAEEVLVEVWDLGRSLSPLQGPWLGLGLGLGHLGAALMTAARWRHDGEHPALAIGARWPELVPGFAAMDRLAGLMVDVLCR